MKCSSSVFLHTHTHTHTTDYNAWGLTGRDFLPHKNINKEETHTTPGCGVQWFDWSFNEQLEGMKKVKVHHDFSIECLGAFC